MSILQLQVLGLRVQGLLPKAQKLIRMLARQVHSVLHRGLTARGIALGASEHMLLAFSSTPPG